MAQHPEQVRTLVAHEPPAAQVLPDREQALAAAVDIHETYQRDGFGPAMAKFIALVGLQGPDPGRLRRRGPDPIRPISGLPTEDDGTRDDPLLGQNMVTCTHYEHDFDALRAAPTRIVVAVGAESEGELAHRAALAVAERLGTEAVIFPSHHGGFLGGEFGDAGRAGRVRRHPARGPRRRRLTLDLAPRLGSSTKRSRAHPRPVPSAFRQMTRASM